MDKYVFLYIDPPDFAERMGALSNEQMQQQLQSWFDWLGGGREAGWLLDDGNALQCAGRVVRADGSVTDGPFAEAKEIVGGHSLIQADDLEAAIALTAGCPLFALGGTVEVRPVMVFD